MAGMSNALVDKIINATTPTGTSAVPGTFAAYGGSAMKVRLNSTASNASAAGTELANGSGYTTGGLAVPETISASSGGSGVSLPQTTAMEWTASGTSWTIVSFDLTDSAGVRTWFGSFTGQPISVADGNTFQIATGGITIDAS